MEKHLQALEAAGEKDGEDGQPLLEDRALELAVDEMFQESGGKWRPWAYNARALRIGEIILLVDSDTVVPDDCLRDAARELTECPEIAIIQHESGKDCLIYVLIHFPTLFEMSSRWHTIISRTGSPISLDGSINALRWLAQMAMLLLLSVIMLS